MGKKNLNNIDLPFILEDKELFSPGVWNNVYFSPVEIDKACKATDFSDKDKRSLFLDHHDKQTSDWVGFVENIRSVEGVMRGDLHIIDKDIAIKLAYGAKFGISPKVGGLEEEGTMKEFTVDNWSIVVTPACKTTYLNNKEVKMDEQVKKDLEAQEVAEEEEQPKVEEEPKKEEEKQPEPKEEEQPKEEEKPKEESSEEELAKKDKEEYPYPEDSEMSKEGMAKVREQASQIADILDVKVAEVMKVLDPLMGKAELKEEPKDDEEEELSDEKLLDLHKKIGEKLSERKSLSEKPTDVKKELGELKDVLDSKQTKMLSEVKDLLGKKDEAIEKLSEKVIKLEKILNEPDKKSTKALSEEKPEGEDEPEVDPEEEYFKKLLSV